MPKDKWTCGDKFPVKDGKLNTGRGKPMPWCSKCPGENAAAPKDQWAGHSTSDHDESKVRKCESGTNQGGGALGNDQGGNEHAAAAAAGVAQLDEEQMKCLQPDM